MGVSLESNTFVTIVNTTQNLSSNLIEAIGNNTSVVKDKTIALSMVTPTGSAYSQSLSITGSVETFTDLPSLASSGEIWVVLDSNRMYLRKDSVWVDIGIVGVKGEKGASGKDGQIKYTGTGPPTVIIGASAGDTYLDLSTGDIYKLN